jgi:flagellar basal-body rod modification protein FlgD
MSSAISGLGNTSSAASPSTSDPQGSNAMGKDAFMKLLVASLQNQDPTAPNDPNQFIAQLAQFSSLEQLQTANTTLESLLTAQTSSSQFNTVNMVGKDALVQTRKATLTADGSAQLTANLSASSASTTLVVTNAAGTQVASVNLGALPAGESPVTWDGTANGTHVPAGDYTLTVAAADGAGKSIPVDQTARRRIDGVSFKGGSAVLLMGTDQVPLANVLEVVEP